MLATLGWLSLQLRTGPLSDPRINLAAALPLIFVYAADRFLPIKLHAFFGFSSPRPRALFVQ